MEPAAWGPWPNRQGRQGSASGCARYPCVGVPPSGGSEAGALAPCTGPIPPYPGLKALAGFRLKPVLRPSRCAQYPRVGVPPSGGSEAGALAPSSAKNQAFHVLPTSRCALIAPPVASRLRHPACGGCGGGSSCSKKNRRPVAGTAARVPQAAGALPTWRAGLPAPRAGRPSPSAGGRRTWRSAPSSRG